MSSVARGRTRSGTVALVVAALALVVATLAVVAGAAHVAQPFRASLMRRHREQRTQQPTADADAAEADANGDASVLLAEEVRIATAASAAKPRDRLNRDRAASSARSRAAAVRRGRQQHTARRPNPHPTHLLQRPANAPHAPRPPAPPRSLGSTRRLVRGNGRRFHRGQATAPARKAPKKAAAAAGEPRPRFVATLGQAKGNAAAGAKAKDFVWSEEGQWHGLTVGEDDDELQPPWVDGPDPLPKKVAEPFTPPKAPIMGFQGDGRFYPPPPPPPPPPPSPYPPPPPPPPPGGGVDAGPGGDDEGDGEFVERAAHVHHVAHPDATPTPSWAHGRDPASGRPNWIPAPEQLQANTPQSPFGLFPSPARGNPQDLTNLHAGAAPGIAAAAPGPVTAASSAAAPAPAAPTGAAPASFDPNFHPAAAATRPVRGPGFGLPLPSPRGGGAGSGDDDGGDSFAAFNRNVRAARAGGAIGHAMQQADAQRMRDAAFEEEMARGAVEEEARLQRLQQQQRVTAHQQQLLQRLQEPLSSASTDGAGAAAFATNGEPFPDHAMEMPPIV